jgi:hypothetical protein
MQFGFITPSLNDSNVKTVTASASNVLSRDDKSNDCASEDWQDITDTESSMEETVEQSNSHNQYSLDVSRRASIDLGHLSVNLHDQSISEMHGGKMNGSSNSTMLHDDGHNNSHKRLRYRQPSIASISEEEPPNNTNNTDSSVLMENDDEEVATVDGNDDADIMEDIEHS